MRRRKRRDRPNQERKRYRITVSDAHTSQPLDERARSPRLHDDGEDKSGASAPESSDGHALFVVRSFAFYFYFFLFFLFFFFKFARFEARLVFTRG